jgi:uncharacterized integral membrane protein (TIGR00697 family)
MKDKKQTLFVILGGFFLANALLAEFIGGKIFSVEKTLGFDPLSLNILGYELPFNMTAGILLWPVVFIMTDIINEYYGKKGVKFLSYLSASLIAYCFVMIYVAMGLTPADWWLVAMKANGVPDMNQAFNAVFGQGMWIILGSLTAFLIGQFIDASMFQWIKRKTGGSKLWLRATGSTLVSQLIDTYVVLFIAFYIGQGFPLKQVVAIGIVGYIYKFLVAIVLTPTLYLLHNWIDRFLGKDLAVQMQNESAAD